MARQGLICNTKVGQGLICNNKVGQVLICLLMVHLEVLEAQLLATVKVLPLDLFLIKLRLLDLFRSPKS